jgi:hypothetical protein
MNNWFVDIGFVPFTRSGYEVRNHNKPGESYWFETREWAQFCADHFNRLEDAAKKPNVIEYRILDYMIPQANTTHIPGLYSPNLSDWHCHLFGGTYENGITYRPLEGNEPNAFQRWLMKVCFDCTWVKK